MNVAMKVLGDARREREAALRAYGDAQRAALAGRGSIRETMAALARIASANESLDVAERVVLDAIAVMQEAG